MSLSINPLAQLVASSSSAISSATAAASGAVSGIGDAISKSGLDSTVSQLSGGLNSGLNGLTSGVTNLANSAQGALGSALGGIGSQVSSAVSSATNSLQSVTGSISNITADISGSLNKLTGGDLAGGLQSALGAISSAAGMLNNILSLRRGINLPAGGELFMKQGAAIKLQPGSKNDWRVRINCDWTAFKSPMFGVLEETGGVVWPYLPTVTVSTKANYTAIDPTHNNYPFQAYKNSHVDEMTISGEFSCETARDAAYWIAATTFFKTATKMFYGSSNLAGNPPIVCNLNGYGASIFNKVPVIIKSFSVDLRDDVNYIQCNTYGTNTWVPVLSTISVTVVPVYNRSDMRKFSLQEYAKGQMVSPAGRGYI